MPQRFPDLARLHAIVRGDVQGVGLTGWVRNRRDGTVETLAEGARAALDAYLLALGTGPRSAHVDGVEHDWSDGTGEFDGFHARFF
jgi:acylphosphatase